MKCIFCGHLESKVVYSRSAEDGTSIRRRRECLECGGVLQAMKESKISLLLLSKDLTRQPFNRDKLLNGLLRACEKRPISIGQLEKIVDEVEEVVRNSLAREVTTTEIGELVMDRLKTIDEISYVRFASVYRQFKDINSFMEELKNL